MSRRIPFCLCVCLTVAAVLPLLPPATFYFLDDGSLHLFRLFELDRVLRQGVPYPRWAPDFAYGYGYPVFNFYPPLAYYIAEALHVAGLDLPMALQATLALIIAIAAFGAYVMGCELFDSAPAPHWAGLLVATAYVFFPYFLLNVYMRGAIAEALGAAILPWTLWALVRAMNRQRVGAVMLCGACVAGLLTSHAHVTYMAAPLLVAFALWELASLPRAWRRRAFACAAISALLGAAVSAWYWLPTFLEVAFVPAGHAAKQFAAIFEWSFLAATNLIQFQIPYAYHEQPYPLSILPLALAVGALALVNRLTTRARRRVWFSATAAIVAMFLLLDVTKPAWLSIPFLNTFLFPWRLSAVIGLSVSLLIGALVPAVERSARSSRARIVLVAFVAAVLIWNGLARLKPQRLDNPRGDLTLGQMARFETNTHSLGFGFLSEYLPLTVQTLVPKLDRTSATAPPSIALESYGAQRIALRVSSFQPETVLLRVFHFAGWQATLDGKPLALFPSTPLGLLTMNLPAGAHRVEVWFGDTLPRQIGAIVSIAAALAFFAATVWLMIRRADHWRAVAATSTLALVIGLPSTVVAFTAPRLPMQPTQVEVTPALHLIGLRVENAARDGTTWRARPGSDVLSIQVVWFVRRQIADQPFAWRLLGEPSRVVAERVQKSRYGTGFPEAWAPNEIVEDRFELPLGAMPAGRYQLQVGYGAKPQFEEVGIVELTQAIASPPSYPPPARPANALVGEHIRLLGANAPARVNVGEVLPVTLFWRAEREVFEDFTVFVQLVDADGQMLAQNDGITHDGFFPTMLWHPGRVVADARALVIPYAATPGIYRLIAGLYRFDTLERLPVTTPDGASPDSIVDLEEVKIPLLASGKPQTTLRASLGDAIQLIGYDLRQGQTLDLALHWQAVARPQTDYHVFVHIVDSQGQVVAQQDNAPRHSRYPTRIWDAGEHVPDAYVLTPRLPPGTYHIVAGMYDPRSGERLIARDEKGNELANRAIPIAAFEVKAR
jgi:hypothetical protein